MHININDKTNILTNHMDLKYKSKYLKYKSKYLNIKKKLESNKNENEIYENKNENEIYEILNIPDKISKIKIVGGESIASIIWNNKNKFMTTLDLPTKRISSINIPHGFKLGSTETMTKNDKITLNKLFDTFEGSEYYTKFPSNHSIFEKNNKDPKIKTRLIRLNINQVLDLIKNNKEFVDIINFYFNKALQNMNITDKNIIKNLKNEVKLSILKYKDNTSNLHCHIDNISGGDGPIVTINVGPSFYYDLIPHIFTEEEFKTRKPIRVKIKENQLTIMDGETRLCWQHCIPLGNHTYSTKFTIKMIFPVINEINPIYNNIYKKKLYTHI